MKDKLLELADRVEALEGPDREVDAEIALAIGVVPDGAFRPCAAIDLGTFATGPYGFWSCEPYTASLDAAIALVPDLGEIDGRRFDLSNFEKRAMARCYSDADTDHKSSAATAALALTAAALRALAQEQGDA